MSTRLATASPHLLRQGPRLVGASVGVSGNNDGAEITQVDLGHPGHGSISSIVPLGLLQTWEQGLGQLHERPGVDLWATLVLVPFVLFFDGLAHTRDTTTKYLLGDRSLLFGELGKGRIAVRPLGAQLLRLGLCGRLGPLGTILRAVAVAAISATTVTVAAASPATTIAASTVTPTAAISTASPTRTLGHERRGDTALVAAPRAQKLQGLRLFAGALGREHRGDFDAIDKEVGFNPELVAHGGTGGHERPVDTALGLPGSDGSPGPGAVFLCTGQFDVNAARHRCLTLPLVGR